MLATKDIWDIAPEAPQPELAHRISDRILIEMKCSYLFLRRPWAKVTRNITLKEDGNRECRSRHATNRPSVELLAPPHFLCVSCGDCYAVSNRLSRSFWERRCWRYFSRPSCNLNPTPTHQENSACSGRSIDISRI